MCICINCKYVKTCSMYQVIEQQHKQEMLIKAQFIPNHSIIRINLISSTSQVDWDLIECMSFVEYPGKWLNA